jgi:hypothetical protein
MQLMRDRYLLVHKERVVNFPDGLPKRSGLNDEIELVEE